MHPRVHYLRLLDEVNEKFDKPDWPTISSWLKDEAQQDRVRRELFVPHSVPALEQSSEPLLQPGDLVRTPILTRQATYQVPPRCQLAGSLHSLGTVELGESVQVAQDVLACNTIRWQGGAHSTVRTLVAPHVHIGSPAGTVLGGIWCDTLTSDEKGADLAPGLVVQGIVVVDAPTNGLLVVGANSQMGGLYVQGNIETQRHVTASYLQASGSVQLGRDNHLGYVQARQIHAATNCQLGVLVSEETIHLAKGSVVDTLRAQGDVVLEQGVTITGNLMVSELGIFKVPVGPGWHSQRDHWFYALPDESLLPYSEESARPPNSRLVALRSLSHALWQQIERLSGRG